VIAALDDVAPTFAEDSWSWPAVCSAKRDADSRARASAEMLLLGASCGHPSPPASAAGPSVASTCNECNETSPESATLLRASLDGKTRSIFAGGLRDVVGWGWHPETGELWGMDHGMDWLGDDQQVEELNRIEKGKHYGWPYVFGERNEINPHIDPPGSYPRTSGVRSASRPRWVTRRIRRRCRCRSIPARNSRRRTAVMRSSRCAGRGTGARHPDMRSFAFTSRAASRSGSSHSSPASLPLPAKPRVRAAMPRAARAVARQPPSAAASSAGGQSSSASAIKRS
jgi:Glucose / Sorbosone dehydrogenase